VVFGGSAMDWRSVDVKAVLMTLLAFGLLTRTKLGLFVLLGLGALVGVLTSMFG
jgi:hypothetical protein